MSSDHGFLFVPSAAGYSSTMHNVEIFICLLLFCAVFAFWLTPGGLAWALLKTQTRPRTDLPGPSGLPLIGSAPVLTNSLAHRLLRKLSQSLQASYLMCFSVGFTRYIISSCPESAKEILNSSAFADRPVKESAYELLFHKAMGFAPYGEYWRNLRRISGTHLFCPRRISRFGEFRERIGLRMVEEMEVQMERNGVVRVKNVLHSGSLNNVMMSVFGKMYDFEGGDGDGDDDGAAAELKRLVKEGYELLGIFNWSDHFPFLGWLDLQGVRRRSQELVCRVNVFVGDIIKEHRLKRGGKNGGGISSSQVSEEKSHDDFVDVLLDLEKENKLTDSEMIAVLWEMIFRGTDTVAILLEWILARMILHPEIQAKAQREIDAVIGTNKAVITDSDVPNLPYTQAIVKETLRMHPPGPLLSWARLAIHDAYVGPHFIPAGTTAMVNMWAITHDGETWPEPDEFRPERFLEEDVSVMGCDLRLAPFGAGRRVCPGKTLGLATVHLWLAHLLHKFRWTHSDTHGVDLSECLKMSMEMKRPLICKVFPRIS
ncbi:cytochrome P450 78A5-like [Henckelia pumila]|uniref:cytochrome P450 78A5-like n=1 Tax=Henckelia pumila TaxID=405737 RepID=UPI003C6DC17B